MLTLKKCQATFCLLGWEQELEPSSGEKTTKTDGTNKDI